MSTGYKGCIENYSKSKQDDSSQLYFITNHLSIRVLVTYFKSYYMILIFPQKDK